MRRAISSIAFACLIAMSSSQISYGAERFERELYSVAKPSISAVASNKEVGISDLVLLNGRYLTQVKQVFVDSKSAEFRLLDDSRLELRIPSGVNPGDAVLRLSGEFGLLSYQGLFEVKPSRYVAETKVSIGSFQGFLAVYTKNFKGRKLNIVAGDKNRVVAELQGDFTRNLTKFERGKSVSVRVFLDDKLIRSEVLIIK